MYVKRMKNYLKTQVTMYRKQIKCDKLDINNNIL